MCLTARPPGQVTSPPDTPLPAPYSECVWSGFSPGGSPGLAPLPAPGPQTLLWPGLFPPTQVGKHLDSKLVPSPACPTSCWPLPPISPWWCLAGQSWGWPWGWLGRQPGPLLQCLTTFILEIFPVCLFSSVPHKSDHDQFQVPMPHLHHRHLLPKVNPFVISSLNV